MKKDRDHSIVHITDPRIEEYALKMTSKESESIEAVVSSSGEELEYIDMLSGNLVGQLLKLLVKVSGARKVLEIGTFTGYSALMMAEALPDAGKVVTIEMNLRYQELAEKHFDKYDRKKKIHLIKGNARDEIDNLTEKFDLVFIDADKLSYEFYFEAVLSKLKKGGLIVTDNVLWDGTVLCPQDYKAEALHEFNLKIASDSRVDQVLLPLRDGVLIAVKN